MRKKKGNKSSKNVNKNDKGLSKSNSNENEQKIFIKKVSFWEQEMSSEMKENILEKKNKEFEIMNKCQENVAKIFGLTLAEESYQYEMTNFQQNLKDFMESRGKISLKLLISLVNDMMTGKFLFIKKNWKRY